MNLFDGWCVSKSFSDGFRMELWFRNLRCESCATWRHGSTSHCLGAQQSWQSSPFVSTRKKADGWVADQCSGKVKHEMYWDVKGSWKLCNALIYSEVGPQACFCCFGQCIHLLSHQNWSREFLNEMDGFRRACLWVFFACYQQMWHRRWQKYDGTASKYNTTVATVIPQHWI